MLGLHASCLPFPRGSTANADGLLTPGDTGLQEFEGKVFEVPDTVHGTAINPLLIILQNDTGAAITVARKFGEFAGATALDFGRRVGTFPCDTEGAICVALDDAYTVGATIADNDLFYGLVYGWCSIATQGTGNFVSQMPVCTSALGVIRNLANPVAGYFVVGTLGYAASYSPNSTAKVFVDCLGFKKPPAAG
jgi:hypothetical protein